MSHRIEIKQDDTRPPVEATLKSADGTAIDLSNVDAGNVKFQVRTKQGEMFINGSCEIVDASAGKVKYEWEEGDTEDVGTYEAEFDVEFQDGNRLTVPNNEFIPVIIYEQIK